MVPVMPLIWTCVLYKPYVKATGKNLIMQKKELISSILAYLYWLSVHFRFDFKISLFAYK